MGEGLVGFPLGVSLPPRPGDEDRRFDDGDCGTLLSGVFARPGLGGVLVEFLSFGDRSPFVERLL